MGEISHKKSRKMPGKTSLKKIFICLAALTALSGQAMGHGGGLDDSGGHHNRKQGGYHFHKGPLAGRSFSSKAEAMAALHKSGASEAAPQQARQNDSAAQDRAPRE